MNNSLDELISSMDDMSVNLVQSLQLDAARKASGDKVATIHVDQYNVDIELVFTSDINKARANRVDRFGPWDADGNVDALCSSEHPTYALFFELNHVNTKNVAHEIWHLTSRIMQGIGATHDPDNDEPYAYLCGYLTSEFYHQCDILGIDYGCSLAARASRAPEGGCQCQGS